MNLSKKEMIDVIVSRAKDIREVEVFHSLDMIYSIRRLKHAIKELDDYFIEYTRETKNYESLPAEVKKYVEENGGYISGISR